MNKKNLIELINNKKFDDAEKKIQLLIQQNANNEEYFFIYGIILANTNRYKEAINYFNKCKDKTTESLFHMGGCHQALGNFQEAIKYYESYINLVKDNNDAYHRLSFCYRYLRDYDQAINYLNRSLEIQTDHTSYLLLGFTYREMGKFSDAKINFNKVLDIKNNNFEAKIALATINLDEGHATKALSLLNNMINDNSLTNEECIKIRIELGNVYKSIGNYTEAINQLKKILNDVPRHPGASYNLSICLLSIKEFDMAWYYHEERFNLSGFGRLRNQLQKFEKPLWNNNRPKKNLLIWSEQGLGDVILYSQFIDLIKREFINLSIAVEKKIIIFFQKIYPDINVIDMDTIDSFKDYDYHLPIGSLGRYFQKKDFKIEYLKRVYKINTNIPLIKKRKLRCGISWTSSNKLFGHKKSIDIKLLKNIFLIPDIEFVNLQFTNDENISPEMENILSMAFIEHKIDCYSDIDGVASLITTCDFVITISNTNAHIAGKLGVKTFLMLPFADGKLWYWGDNNEDAILWYPSISPIRQSQNGDWISCISQLSIEIGKLL